MVNRATHVPVNGGCTLIMKKPPNTGGFFAEYSSRERRAAKEPESKDFGEGR